MTAKSMAPCVCVCVGGVGGESWVEWWGWCVYVHVCVGVGVGGQRGGRSKGGSCQGGVKKRNKKRWRGAPWRAREAELGGGGRECRRRAPTMRSRRRTRSSKMMASTAEAGRRAQQAGGHSRQGSWRGRDARWWAGLRMPASVGKFWQFARALPCLSSGNDSQYPAWAALAWALEHQGTEPGQAAAPKECPGCGPAPAHGQPCQASSKAHQAAAEGGRGRRTCRDALLAGEHLV